MSDENPPSELVAGKYKLTRLLGRGGMGSVWEGVHISLGSRVACKFIEPEYVDSQDAVNRFENEARAAASLRSKHVVDVYDHGIMPDGRPYIVMEYLQGEPLDSRLARVGTMTIVEIAGIVQQVSRALQRAHGAGIVHRDLKPENIFLVWDDEDQIDVAKVVDFGIAKFTESSSSGVSSATRTGSIMGTPYYMSPEQARGLKNVDARADIWSLGVITYEALTGVRPFDGEAIGDILVKICTDSPVPPSQLQPQLPHSVDTWMERALAQNPDERFQEARQLAESLTTLSGAPGRTTVGSAINVDGPQKEPARGSVPATRRVGSPEDPKKTSGAVTHAAVETQVGEVPVKKSQPLIWVGAAVVLLAAGIGLAMGSSSSPPSEDELEAKSEEEAKDDPTETAASEDEKSELAEPAKPAVDETQQLPQPEANPEPKPSAPAVTRAPAPPPKPTLRVVAPTPKPKPKPVVQPRPVASPPPRPAPRPVASPPPRPAPAPSNSNLDLGY